jgi:hypothetical protein
MSLPARARLLALALASVALCASGCAATFARPADFDAYRRYRTAPSYEARLHEAWAYLKSEPRGRFRAEVEAWFVPEERRWFEVAGRSPGAATAYLATLPDGPHADEERAWLRAWEKQRDEEPLRRRQALEEAQRRAEQARRALGDTIERWTERALTITRWGEPLGSVEESFVLPWREEAPLPVCEGERCRKHYAFTYAVPDATTARDRTVTLDVEAELAGPRLQVIELRAHRRGFDWWLEGSEARGVDPINGEIRAEAVTRAKDRIEALTRKALGRCTTQEGERARVVDCGAVWVVIDPAPPEAENGDDVVRIVGL